MAHLSNEKVWPVYMEQMRWNGNPVCPYGRHSKPYRLKLPGLQKRFPDNGGLTKKIACKY